MAPGVNPSRVPIIIVQGKALHTKRPAGGGRHEYCLYSKWRRIRNEPPILTCFSQRVQSVTVVNINEHSQKIDYYAQTKDGPYQPTTMPWPCAPRATPPKNRR